jgi:hypothetical protein
VTCRVPTPISLYWEISGSHNVWLLSRMLACAATAAATTTAPMWQSWPQVRRDDCNLINYNLLSSVWHRTAIVRTLSTGRATTTSRPWWSPTAPPPNGTTTATKVSWSVPPCTTASPNQSLRAPVLEGFVQSSVMVPVWDSFLNTNAKRRRPVAVMHALFNWTSFWDHQAQSLQPLLALHSLSLSATNATLVMVTSCGGLESAATWILSEPMRFVGWGNVQDPALESRMVCVFVIFARASNACCGRSLLTLFFVRLKLCGSRLHSSARPH